MNFASLKWAFVLYLDILIWKATRQELNIFLSNGCPSRFVTSGAAVEKYPVPETQSRAWLRAFILPSQPTSQVQKINQLWKVWWLNHPWDHIQSSLMTNQTMATNCHQAGQDAFSVTLAASALANLQEPLTGETTPHIIHTVSVSQPRKIKLLQKV